jgi:aldehyde dehydrogenase (NAD+)
MSSALSRSLALSAVSRSVSLSRCLSTFTGKLPQVKFQTQLYINGEFHASGTKFPVISPANNEIVTEVHAAGSREVNLAVDSAAHAMRENSKWRTMHPRARGNLMLKLAELIEKNAEELATLEAMNNGKTFLHASTQDVPATAAMFRYWAGWADKITGKTIPIGNEHFCYTHHEPVGVCALIVPWNLPLIACAAKLGPALAAGNTCVLKSAEQTPLSALKLAELVHQAGFPAGVVNILSGNGPDCGALLVSHPSINKISFTGSVEVGKIIQKAASSGMKRTTMELGGKNPVIVCEDADLENAVKIIHNGLFWNKGEACAAASRIFVHESIQEKFIALSKKLVEARVVGHPFAKDLKRIDQGAQVSEEHLKKIQSFIEIGLKEGAKLECGGKRYDVPGNYLQPTLFSHVTDNMTIFKEEIFGPVMTINTFKSVDEVVERANNSPYGLAAGVFTQNIAMANRLSRQIKAGLVFVNCYHVVDVSAPFGGFKESGLGREGGEYGLLPYLEVKNVVNRV